MASDKESKNLPVIGLVATAAAITGAILYTQVPLEVPRPGSSQGLAYRDRSVQDVSARLWEDPFAAVSRQVRESAARQDTAALVEIAKAAQQEAQEQAGVRAPSAAPEPGAGARTEPLPGELDPCDSPRVRRPECVPHSLAWLMRDVRFALGHERGEKKPAPAEAGQPDTKTPRVLVLGVMVSNSPYVDGEERRRRLRYAVQSALNLGQYSPLNAEHIGYVLNDQEPGLPQVIPFEWFRRKGGRPERRALVLWLEEESLAGYPARSPAPMANLGTLVHIFRSQTQSQEPQLEFKFIGPATSGTLKTITSELRRYRGDKAEQAPPPALVSALAAVQMYSPLATASEEQMICNKKERKAAREAGDPQACTLASFLQRNAKRLFGDAPKALQFFRSIASDDAVTYSLIDELKRRGVELGGGRDHVALVSEWDTYYGRMLPQAFIRSVDDVENFGQNRYQNACEEDPEDAVRKSADARAAFCPILRFSYLRGLDGTAAGASTAAAAASTASKADGGKKTNVAELPEGTKQFDYLRRLADRIHESNLELRRQGKEIRAIGIIGSDVYDKLAVLRALRKQFPRALFFSTDLDARLLDPGDYAFTRNLIIGTGFGLHLHPCLQKEIPPFRNSYQTSTFFATRLGLFNAFADVQKRVDVCSEYLDEQTAHDLTDAAPVLSEDSIASWLYPRIYEVGKSRAWDLTVEPITAPTLGASGTRCLGLHLCSNIHPPRAHLVQRSTRIAWITLGALLAGGGGLLLWRRKKAHEEDSAETAPKRRRSARLLPWVRWGLILWALVLTIICMIYAAQNWGKPEGEPFAWTDGVSIWPTQLLRLVAILLAAFFVGDVYTRIRRNNDDLTRDLALRNGRDPRTAWQKLLGTFVVPTQSSAVDAANLWHQYLESGRARYSVPRALIFAALFGAIGLGLFQLFGWPNRPYRGAVSNVIDWVLLGHVGFLALFLLFSVNDATRLTTVFIHTLTKHQTQLVWPQATVRRFSDRLGQNVSDYMAAWFVTVHLIAKRTAAISSLIYYPFVVGALVAVCQSAVFDNWNMTIGLLAMLALGLAIAATSPLMMQIAANKAKTERLKALKAKLLQSKGSAKETRITALSALIEHLEAVKEGAFQPFLDQPLVRAALLPFGGAGGLYLLDLFNFVRF